LTFPHPGLYWIYGNKDDDDDDSIKSTIFWDITPCGAIEVWQRIRGTHLQMRTIALAFLAYS
jgi:hypothetical protein